MGSLVWKSEKRVLIRFEQNVTRIVKPSDCRFTQLTHSPDYKIDPKPTTMVIYSELGKPVQFLFCLIDRFFRKKNTILCRQRNYEKAKAVL